MNEEEKEVKFTSMMFEPIIFDCSTMFALKLSNVCIKFKIVSENTASVLINLLVDADNIINFKRHHDH